MTNKYERPDPSAPPENKYISEHPICPECNEKIEGTRDDIKDCVDHAPIDTLVEMCEDPRVATVSLQKGVTGVGAEDYDRCLRALNRAVDAWKKCQAKCY